MYAKRGLNWGFVAISLLSVFLAEPSWAQTIEAGVFPSGRAVQEGNLAAAFLTLNNTGTVDALGCTVEPINSVPASFLYAQVDPVTSAIIGPTNGPFTIPGGGSVKLNVTFVTTNSFSPIEVFFNVTCTNPISFPNSTGLNTLLLSASSMPIADIVALTSAPSGRVTLPTPIATEGFLIASLNLGAGDLVTMSADTGNSSLPLNLLVCEFDASIGNCVAPPSPTTTKTTNAGEITFYAVFVGGQGTPIPFNAATNRVYARFRDSGNVVRGLTSVAVVVEGTLPTVLDISGNWFAQETVTATCSLAGEQDTFTERGTGNITISQNGQQVSYIPPGAPPDFIRTGLVTGNTVQFSGKFIALPGIEVIFTQNSATANGTITTNRIDLIGTGIARGTVVGLGQGECTGNSTATLTR